MGLAGKIKNASSTSTTPQHPQPQQPAASPYEGGSAPVYDYPPPLQPQPQPQPQSQSQSQSQGAHDGRYGTSQYDYPQHVGKEYMPPLQHGAPSAPPFPEAQQSYAGGYPSPRREHPVQPHQQLHVESIPYGVQGQYNGASPRREHPVQPHQQLHVESMPYGVQGQTPPYYAEQGPISPSYGVQGQTPPYYAGQGPISPSYGVQGQTPPYYAGQGPISPSYGEQVQTPSSTYGAGAQMQPAASIEMLAHKLKAIIQANGLQPFYDQGRFQATLQKVAYINFAEIAAHWRIGIELAYDLAPLALYDIVFYCDDSGSMAFEEDGERIDDLKLILSKVSDIATKFDDDGIIVRFMNSEVNGDGIRNAADVANLISRVRFSGMTPLGTNLERKVIQPFVLGQAMSNMAKPVLAIIITDGEPSGEDHGTIRQVIHRAKDALTRTRYGGGAFAVQIAQVGKDARTQKFLESLDKDPIIGGMIDCTSYYELEEEEFARKGVTLTPELWLLKMCVGAIDPEYDSKDD